MSVHLGWSIAEGSKSQWDDIPWLSCGYCLRLDRFTVCLDNSTERFLFFSIWKRSRTRMEAAVGGTDIQG